MQVWRKAQRELFGEVVGEERWRPVLCGISEAAEHWETVMWVWSESESGPGHLDSGKTCGTPPFCAGSAAVN